MKKGSLLFVLLWIGCSAFAQAVFTTTGDWHVASNWLGNNIGDDINEDVTISANRTAFIVSGFSYTIGNLTFNNNAGLTVNTGGTLNVGDALNSRNATVNNNASITVAGTLIIWGDLVVNNNLSLNITGIMIVKGNIVMGNNASLSVSGNLEVDGNFVGGNNTNVTITGGGGVLVRGTVTVGNNSNLTGPPGSFVTLGGCTQGGGSTFCNSGALPVKLLFFTAALEGKAATLSWATEKEEYFDYFEIEKAASDFTFTPIARVPGAGYNVYAIRNYVYVDNAPYPGINYYRLKAVDLDGSYQYFHVVSVHHLAEASFGVYPNPVTAQLLRYRIDFTPSPADRLRLTDLHGRTMLEFPVPGAGVNEQHLEGVLPGVYLLHYCGQGLRKTIRIVVQ
jgi:hypothetical protein